MRIGRFTGALIAATTMTAMVVVADPAQATVPPGWNPPLSPYSAIRGAGDSFPNLCAQYAVSNGYVTAMYPTGGFNGFYAQSNTDGVASTPGQGSNGLWFKASEFSTTLADGTVVPQVELGHAVLPVVCQASLVNGIATAGDSNSTFQSRTGGNDAVAVPPISLPSLPSTDAARLSLDGQLVHPSETFTVTSTNHLVDFGQVTLTSPSGSVVLDDGSSWNLQTDPQAHDFGKPYTNLSVGQRIKFSGNVIFARRDGQWLLEPTRHVSDAGSDFLFVVPAPSLHAQQTSSSYSFVETDPYPQDKILIASIVNGKLAITSVSASRAATGTGLVGDWGAAAVIIHNGRPVASTLRGAGNFSAHKSALLKAVSSGTVARSAATIGHGA